MATYESLSLDGLELNDSTTYRLLDSLEIAPPSKRLLWLAGREGDALGDTPGYDRRAVTFKVMMIAGTSMDTALTSLGALTDKLQKAERTEGGISLVWTPANSTYSKTIKVLAGEVTELPVSADAQYFKSRPVVTVRLDCKPFLYGTESTLATVTASTPHVTAMVRDVDGDVPAEARVILTDMASQERDFAEYGIDPNPVTVESYGTDRGADFGMSLSSLNGTTDFSGNGYTATGSGGVSTGAATGLLTGDDSTSTRFDGVDDFYSTTYNSRRNLCTNPRAENGITAWAVSGLTTFEAITAPTQSGLPSGITWKAFHAIGNASGQNTTCSFSVTVGRTYTVSIYVRLRSTFTASSVRINGRDVGGASLATTDVTTIGGNFQRYSVTFTPTATGSASVRLSQQGAGTGEWDFTGCLQEETSTLDPYFDGAGYVNSAGAYVTSSTATGWLGTAHNSASDKGPFANGTVRGFFVIVNADSLASNRGLMGSSSDGPGITTTGAMRLAIGGATTDSNAGDVSASTTYALYFEFDEPNDTARFYRDGILVDTNTGLAAQWSAQAAFNLGKGLGTPLDGRLSYPMVFEGGLTADQVAQLSLAAKSPYLYDSAWLSTTGLSGSGNTRSGAYNPVGSGNTVIRGTTATQWVGLCETGALPHVGAYRVKARVYTTATDAQVRIAWKVGDGSFSRNAPVEPQVSSAWAELDLGMVYLTEVPSGAQQSKVRVEFMADTSNQTVDVDYLELIPADRYGKARAPGGNFAPAAVFSAQSGFDTEAGAITGDSLTIGGAWTVVTNSDANDFTAAAGVATRADVSDSGTGALFMAGRGVTASTTNYAAVASVIDIKFSAAVTNQYQGLLARVVDSSNYFLLATTSKTLALEVVIAGAGTVLDTASVSLVADTFYTLRLMALADGSAQGAIYNQGATTPFAEVAGSHSSLATGGTLASGRTGIIDYAAAATANTRTYDNFAAWIPEPNAAIFSGKTIQFRYDETLRDDSGATVLGRPPIARGARAFIPQAGSEGKISRVFGKATRSDTETASRENISDSTKLEVAVTPRSLVAPR